MKNLLRMTLVVSLMGLGLSACGGEEPAEEPTEEPTTEEPAVEEPATEEPEVEEPVAEAEPSAEELPIAEDFEEEVAEAITAENYDDVLTQIEAELAPAAE